MTTTMKKTQLLEEKEILMKKLEQSSMEEMNDILERIYLIDADLNLNNKE